MSRKPKDESLIKYQRVRTRRPGFTVSQNYEKWRKDQQRYDASGIADPDFLGDVADDPLSTLERQEIENECRTKVQLIIKRAKEILTEREFEVFQMLTVDFISMNTAAKKLSSKYGVSVSKSAVQGTWERVREKFERHGIV